MSGLYVGSSSALSSYFLGMSLFYSTESSPLVSVRDSHSTTMRVASHNNVSLPSLSSKLVSRTLSNREVTKECYYSALQCHCAESLGVDVNECNTNGVFINRSKPIGEAVLRFLKSNLDLDLSWDMITTEHLKQITHLDLSNQSISSLHEYDFDGLTELVSLNLSSNQLRYLDLSDSLLRIQSLDISYNQLTYLALSSKFKSLTYLNLSHNDLHTLVLPETWTSSLDLDISFNQFTSLNIFPYLNSSLRLNSINLVENPVDISAPIFNFLIHTQPNLKIYYSSNSSFNTVRIDTGQSLLEVHSIKQFFDFVSDASGLIYFTPSLRNLPLEVGTLSTHEQEFLYTFFQDLLPAHGADWSQRLYAKYQCSTRLSVDVSQCNSQGVFTNRSSFVSESILKLISSSDMSWDSVTQADLQGIDTLDLSNLLGMQSVDPIDFDGLSLSVLRFSNNDITELPLAILDVLSEDSFLYVDGNPLTFSYDFFKYLTDSIRSAQNDNFRLPYSRLFRDQIYVVTSKDSNSRILLSSVSSFFHVGKTSDNVDYIQLQSSGLLNLPETSILSVDQSDFLYSYFKDELELYEDRYSWVFDLLKVRRIKDCSQRLNVDVSSCNNYGVFTARSAEVRNAILRLIPSVSSWDTIRLNMLREIKTLDLSSQGIVTLRPYDFDGLDFLENLFLNNNKLTHLQASVFDPLPNLSLLSVYGNSFSFSIPLFSRFVSTNDSFSLHYASTLFEDSVYVDVFNMSAPLSFFDTIFNSSQVNDDFYASPSSFVFRDSYAELSELEENFLCTYYRFDLLSSDVLASHHQYRYCNRIYPIQVELFPEVNATLSSTLDPSSSDDLGLKMGLSIGLGVPVLISLLFFFIVLIKIGCNKNSRVYRFFESVRSKPVTTSIDANNVVEMMNYRLQHPGESSRIPLKYNDSYANMDDFNYLKIVPEDYLVDDDETDYVVQKFSKMIPSLDPLCSSVQLNATPNLDSKITRFRSFTASVPYVPPRPKNFPKNSIKSSSLSEILDCDTDEKGYVFIGPADPSTDKVVDLDAISNASSDAYIDPKNVLGPNSRSSLKPPLPPRKPTLTNLSNKFPPISEYSDVEFPGIPEKPLVSSDVPPPLPPPRKSSSFSESDKNERLLSELYECAFIDSAVVSSSSQPPSLPPRKKSPSDASLSLSPTSSDSPTDVSLTIPSRPPRKPKTRPKKVSDSEQSSSIISNDSAQKDPLTSQADLQFSTQSSTLLSNIQSSASVSSLQGSVSIAGSSDSKSLARSASSLSLADPTPPPRKFKHSSRPLSTSCLLKRSTSDS